MKLKTRRNFLIKVFIVIGVIIGFLSNLGTVHNFYADKIVPSWIYFSSWVKSEPSDMRQFRLIMADIEKYESRLSKSDKKNRELWGELDKLEDEREFYESKLRQLTKEKERVMKQPTEQHEPIKEKKKEIISYKWVLPDIIKEQRITIVALGNNIYKLKFNLIGMKLLKEKDGKEIITYNLADFLTMGGHFTLAGFYCHKEYGYYSLNGMRIKNLISEKDPGRFSTTLENTTGGIFIGWITSQFTIEGEGEQNTGDIITKDMTDNPSFPGMVEAKTLINEYNIPLTGTFQKAFSSFGLYLPNIDSLLKTLAESRIFAFESIGPETFKFLSENG